MRTDSLAVRAAGLLTAPRVAACSANHGAPESTRPTASGPAKARQAFSGAPLSSVVAEAGTPNTATIDTVALNANHDAIRRADAPIPCDQGGFGASGSGPGSP